MFRTIVTIFIGLISVNLGMLMRSFQVPHDVSTLPPPRLTASFTVPEVSETFSVPVIPLRTDNELLDPEFLRIVVSDDRSEIIIIDSRDGKKAGTISSEDRWGISGTDGAPLPVIFENALVLPKTRKILFQFRYASEDRVESAEDVSFVGTADLNGGGATVTNFRESGVRSIAVSPDETRVAFIGNYSESAKEKQCGGSDKVGIFDLENGERTYAPLPFLKGTEASVFPRIGDLSWRDAETVNFALKNVPCGGASDADDSYRIYSFSVATGALSETKFDASTAGSADVELVFALSPLSTFNGFIDVVDENGIIRGAVARPLELVEAVTFINNTSGDAYLEAVINSAASGFVLRGEPFNSVPLMILSDSFRTENGDAVCAGRDIQNLSQKNECVFERPVVIPQGGTLTVRGKLFIVPVGEPYGSGPVTEVTGNEGNGYFFADPEGDKAPVLFVFPNFSGKSENGAETYRLGGFIALNGITEEILPQTFRVRGADGQELSLKTRFMKTGTDIRTVAVPGKELEDLPREEFDERTFSFQAFLHALGVLNREDVIGIFDSRTEAALKTIQNSAGIAETGEADDATRYVLRLRARDAGFPGVSEGGQLTVITDGTVFNFRVFGTETEIIKLGIDRTDTSGDIVAFSDGGQTLKTADGTIELANVGAEDLRCELKSPEEKTVLAFVLPPNRMRTVSAYENIGISESVLHTLVCGKTKLQIEMQP